MRHLEKPSDKSGGIRSKISLLLPRDTPLRTFLGCGDTNFPSKYLLPRASIKISPANLDTNFSPPSPNDAEQFRQIIPTNFSPEPSLPPLSTAATNFLNGDYLPKIKKKQVVYFNHPFSQLKLTFVVSCNSIYSITLSHQVSHSFNSVHL